VVPQRNALTTSASTTLLALFSLYELIRKRTDTDVAFTREFTLDIKSKKR
jgi:hypothetical protein